MNTLRTAAIIFLAFLASFANAQNTPDDALGLPGDNLNLFATLALFQESETLEAFEQRLNDEESKINNLDLDGDERIDYIQVIDNVSNDVHNIVLRIDINPKESQDVAVFTVWKDAQGQVQIQLTGDEALYGKDYIIEPNTGSALSRGETPNPGYTGQQRVVETRTEVVVSEPIIEISAWPIISFIYLPTYVCWHSPWYYGYYPNYWRPWKPYYWHYYYGYHSNYNPYYYGYYRHWHHHRHNHWDRDYYGHRRSSEVVYAKRKSGLYRETYSRPELRKEGQELYTRTQKDQPRRRFTGGNVSPNARPTSNGNTTNSRRQGQNIHPQTGGRPTTGTATQAERPQTHNNRPIKVEERSRPADRPSTNRPSKVEERRQPPSNTQVNRPSQRKETQQAAPRNERKTERPSNSPARQQNKKSESKSSKGEGRRT